MVIWHKHPDLVASLPTLRKKNPHVKVLLYRELFCVLRHETFMAESVGHYEWIMANHPEWFQKDVQGNFVEITDYPGRFMMDLGNPEWQDFWINETLKDVKDGNWDGVFVDDVLTSVKMHQLPSLRNYSDDLSLQAAVYGFLKKVYTAFQAEGKLVISNVSNSHDYPGLFNQWLQVNDGIMEEHCSGESWSWGPQVGEAQFQAMQSARASDKWYLCMTYGSWDDTARRDLSLATYLIGSGGKVRWSYRPYNEFHEQLPTDPDWIQDIGEPLGDSQRNGAVWYRQFEGGVLFVNPTWSPQSIEYFGMEYSVAPRSLKKIIGKRPLNGEH